MTNPEESEEMRNKYRKKPVEVEAWRTNSRSPYPKWIKEAIELGDVWQTPTGWTISTLEGTHHASAGDWIIQGVEGELYPCKPNIFEQTYEKAQ